ncbi:MAG: EutN/CcmL family microcompartment protein [Candidatus Hodarchaeales archaeon]|jgi:ethanolamine utilization protein EutN
MLIARVIGNLVSTVKTKSHASLKMLALRQINLKGELEGRTFLAVDAGQAGVGDLVLVCLEGNSIRQLLGIKDAAINAAIIGIIDFIETKEGMIQLNS